MGSAVLAGSAVEPVAAPTPRESDTYHTLLARLQTPEDAARLPVPVAEVVQSFAAPVTKTFTGGPGARYRRVTISVRTRLAHWDPAIAGDLIPAVAGASTVGYYIWRWNTSARGHDLTIRADNLLMLDPAYVAAGERDVLGRFMDEALLYHELLHGQLMLDAMDGAAWRARLCADGRFSSAGSDPDHLRIAGLERAYLAARSGPYAFSVRPAANGDDTGAFVLPVEDAPSGYAGLITMSFRATASSNVRDLRLELPRSGPYRGKVVVRGTLVDPTRDGFFLARVDPQGA